MQTAEKKTLIHLTINGHSTCVEKGSTVYQAAKQIGVDIPVFCYHDRMPPFGACRMCLVEVEKSGKLQASCTLEATEGMVVHTETAHAVEGREQILEFLLLNHPLDCPICDRGGECPLQDHTLKHGPGKSRFFEEKRRFKKPIPLGPVLMLDRERCIVCARCTRFGELVAGDHALTFLERGYRTEVGTANGKPVESKFIGNTISICPVGALTSQVYRFRARPWDNEATPSTCTLCPVGCSLFLDERDGEIMRTRGREDPAVNDVWLCDKGFFGYEFTSHAERLTQPLLRRGSSFEPISWEEALTLIATQVTHFKPAGKLAALGGNPLTVEENYLFQQLARTVYGTPHLDHRVGMPTLSLDQEGIEPGLTIDLGQCATLQYAALLGADLTEEFPLLWLRLKQAINQKASVLFLGHYAPEISPHLTKTLLHAPGEELATLKEHLPHLSMLGRGGKKGALFVGSQYLNSPDRLAILSLLQECCSSTPGLTLHLLEGKENSLGARLAGMRPDLGPLKKPIPSPGMNFSLLSQTIAEKGWDFLHVAGANPALKMAQAQWKALRDRLKFLVVQDLFLTETAQEADLVLPALSFVEKSGTFLNIAGHMQKLTPGKNLPHGVYSDAEIFSLIAEKLSHSLSLDKNFAAELQEKRAPLSQTQLSPGASFSTPQQQEDALRATFAPSLFDQGVRMRHNPHTGKLAKYPYIRLNPLEGAKRGFQSGDCVLVSTDRGTVKSVVEFHERVADGTVVLPLGFPELPLFELGSELQNGLLVALKREVSCLQ